MPLLTVEGIYRDGRVELSERPEHVEEARRVLVTVLPSDSFSDKPMSSEGQDRESLRQQAFARMREGIYLGGGPYPNREELYDRFER